MKKITTNNVIKVREEKIPMLLKFTERTYRNLTGHLIEKNLTISTMESCTGGMICSLLTDTEGASAVVKGASVTYCNEEKIRCGVSGKIIEKYGVYSEKTAEAMAKTAMKTEKTDIGLGITGTFSNTDPNNADSVPGEIFFAIAMKKEKTETFTFRISGLPVMKRHDAKLVAAYYAAEKLMSLI